jgi:tetratricopeptide (TPR) repeat protein
MASSKFSSEGFDLDALKASENIAGNGESDVVYEIGGGVTTTVPTTAAETSNADEMGNVQLQEPLTPLQKAEEWKQKGNEEFKKKNFLEAYDLYTEAIDACPYPMNGEEVLRQRDEFNAAEREKARQRMDEETRRGRKSSQDKDAKKEDGEEKTLKQEVEEADGPAMFVLPVHDNYDKLAVYYCNRAATSMHMERYDDAIKDADVAILLNPKYTKAFTRRSAAFEKTERTEEALRDAKQALELEPSNAAIRKSVSRLQKIEDERLEKLKVRILQG